LKNVSGPPRTVDEDVDDIEMVRETEMVKDTIKTEI
jgi:hypothetical protein